MIADALRRQSAARLLKWFLVINFANLPVQDNFHLGAALRRTSTLSRSSSRRSWPYSLATGGWGAIQTHRLYHLHGGELLAKQELKPRSSIYQYMLLFSPIGPICPLISGMGGRRLGHQSHRLQTYRPVVRKGCSLLLGITFRVAINLDQLKTLPNQYH
jgi:hypothetical protein